MTTLDISALYAATGQAKLAELPQYEQAAFVHAASGNRAAAGATAAEADPMRPNPLPGLRQGGGGGSPQPA